MVATVVELKSSARAVSYFERDGYYAKNDPEHRQASFWHGGAATALGLRAHVRPSRFEEVLSGRVPGTDIRLGRMREGEHEHRPGWDITLSAPKSVSLEALVVGDRRVIRAHDEAVRATLDWVETELLETRGWDPATRRRPRVKADGMVIAGFRHLTSRDRDPQLHTHCVLANMTRTASGEWRSVEPTRIRRSAKLIGAYYRNELARRLQALGMAVTPRMVGQVPGFELAGYDRSFLDAFSGRRREILAHLERLGLPYTPQLAQMAALHTRRRKKDTGLAQLVPAWREKARALELGREKTALAPPRRIDPMTGERVEVPRVPPPDLPANAIRGMKRAPALPKLPRENAARQTAPPPSRPFPPAELSPEPEVGVLEAVARAVAHAAERRTTVPEAEIRAVALGHAPGRYTLSQVDAAIDRLVGGGELIEAERRGTDRAFVTDRAVKAERRVLAAMRAGRGKSMALAGGETVEERLAQTRLTDGQKEAVRTVLLSGDLVMGVQGHAGSGKTTMLREVKALLDGRTIQGLAPSAAAARVLEREAGIPSNTLQYFLTRFGDLADPEALARARGEYAGSVLAVDEASMIDTMRMADLLRIADRLGVARVALVGDTAQLRAVDAGQPFRLLQKAGMKTAAMTEILRQRDPELLRAVRRTREGEPGAAIEGLGDRVREAPREELGYEAARHWLALPPQQRADTLLLAPTHAIRRQANEAVREGLETEGVLHGRVLEIDRLVDRRLTRAQASDIASYQPGDLAVFHRDHYGCRQDDVCTVTGIEDGMVMLAHPDGEERRFSPSGNAAWYLRICDTERIELRAGDRIRWTRNRKAPRSGAPDLVNGGEAGIVDIDRKRVRFRDGEGREFNLALGDPQLRHLDHAYCSTVHSAQGRTAGAAIAVLDAGGAADRALFHVELSRAADEFLLLTDDREALVETLEAREGVEDGALEALGIDPAAIPAVDPELFADLSRDWRALRQKAEEARTVPFFLPGYRDTMATAVALSEIEDLPADMRRLVDGMVEEHEKHLGRDREVRSLIDRIRENSDDWPELGWVARARGCAVEELPSYGAWRDEGTALLEAARETLRRNGEAGRQLDALPGAGLAGAVGTLERTRLIDEAARFERLWRGVRERAARDGVPELHAEGYGEAAELGATLAAAEGLDRRGRGVLDEWRAVHAAQTALAEAVHTLPGRVAAWRERRNDLPLDGRGGIDPADPACAAWREDGARLGLAGAAMLGAGDAHAPYLDAVPGAAAAVERAAEAVRDALAEHRHAEFAWLARELNRRSKETGIERVHLPRYADTIAAARLLSARPVSGERREAVDSWLRYDETHARLCAEIRDWPTLAGALAAECPERPARLDTLIGWRQRAESLRGEADAMGAQKSPHAPHLAAMAEERAALDAAVLRLERTVAAVEVREMDLLATRARRQAEGAGGIAYDAPGWPELMARVRALDARPGLPEEPRVRVDGHLDRNRRWKAERERVGAFLDRAGEVLRARERLAETAAREAAPEWERWKRDADRIAAEAAALSGDIPQPERAAHLIALGAEPDGIDGKRGEIRKRIARDEAVRVAAVEAERLEKERIAEETARTAERARTAAEEEDRRRMRDKERVAAFLERAPAVENGWIHAEFGMLASPEAERAAARQGWLEDARDLRGEADAIERDIPEEELEDHLRALGAPPGAVANRKATIGSGIGIVERALAGERAERAGAARERRQPAPVRSLEPGETPAESLQETMERARAARAGGVTMVLAGHVPDADREAVYRRLDGLRTAVPAIRLLLGDAPGFERIAAEWARDRGVEHFVFRAGPEAGPDAALERDRAIVEARPAGVMVFSDGREPGFLAEHAEEQGIPVSILPTADLVRTARQSMDRDQEAREAQDRTIRKGPSMGF